MPKRFPRPCPTCGVTFTTNKCANCSQPRQDTPERLAKKKFLYGGDYQARARVIRETATVCHICKQQFKPGDRVEADHLLPHLGWQSPLAPAHRKCNREKGNTPTT